MGEGALNGRKTLYILYSASTRAPGSGTTIRPSRPRDKVCLRAGVPIASAFGKIIRLGVRPYRPARVFFIVALRRRLLSKAVSLITEARSWNLNSSRCPFIWLIAQSRSRALEPLSHARRNSFTNCRGFILRCELECIRF